MLSCFQPKNTWVMGDAPDDHIKRIGGAILTDSLSELQGKIVICQPINGLEIQGETSLLDFKHPENAIYVFGSNHVHMRSNDFEGLDYETVYIPSDSQSDMYNFASAGIILFDRLSKNG